MNARYDGKPLLRLVDSYVLDAIGELDAETQQTLVEMEPKLREVYGLPGGWREIVVGTMKFPDGMAGAIREVWEKGRVKFFASQGHQPDPREFTYSFVDTNFPH